MISFELRSMTHEINEEDARRFQAAKFYDPRGYGFFDFRSSRDGAWWVVRWSCRDSAD